MPGRCPLRSRSRSLLKGSSFRLLIRSASHIPTMGAARTNVIARHMPTNINAGAFSFGGLFASGDILSSSFGTCNRSNNRGGPSLDVTVGSATFGAIMASEGKMTIHLSCAA